MKNVIDRMIEPFAPSWAARRMAARTVLNAYDAAKPGRTKKNERSSLSGDWTAQIAGKSLREQARWLDENHDIVTGIFDRLEERVVGADGIGVEPVPLTLTGERHRALAAQLKTLWAEWSLAPETTGEMTRPEMERMVARSWLRDGEVLAQKLRGRVPKYEHLTRVPFALECLEADYLPIEYNDPAQNIFSGIERNQWRRPVAYHISKQHPGDMLGFSYSTKRVLARNMIHLVHRKRLHQSRGITLLHAVLTRLADLKDYEESERVAARIAASLSMYIKKGDPYTYTGGNETGPPTGDGKSGSAAREIPIAPGMVFDGLMPGEDVGMIESNRPSSLLEGFRGAMVRAVAAGSRSSYSTINRDYNGTYSAQRQELVEAQKGYELLQGMFRDQWARPVYRDFVDMAVASGAVTLPPDLDRSTLYNAFYLGPTMPWIDPAKEAKAWRELVESGFADEAEVVRARGRNPQELKQNRADEVAQNRAEGLVFSSDAYHEFYGGQPRDDNARNTPDRDDPDAEGDGRD